MIPCNNTGPFGAMLLKEGVQFRLWAPGAKTVELVIEGPTPRLSLSMGALGDGWFEELVEAAQPGCLYRYRIDGGTLVPDPASRFQPSDVHGPSLVVDPTAYRWRQSAWEGRPWEQAIVYELHVGTFTREGNYDGVFHRLDYLSELGVTVIELMPLADFSGGRNWGYDGVLPFAPDSSYGTPDDLKCLIDGAHERDLMVFLDVVYNHFGPDGNYLQVYAPQFFTDRVATPWGPAIDFDRREVRDFFIQNALYWLEEYRFDGLRLDAVHAIRDQRSPDILQELAQEVEKRFANERHVHLVLENDDNAARYLSRSSSGRPQYYTAQWNDDLHHALHVLATGEHGGYYEDYTEPVDLLARCLTEGFAYQGEPSKHRDGNLRGTPSAHLPLTAFVSFIQNHDQIGNRAFGERLIGLAERQRLAALIPLAILSPSPPLLFMGEEWGASEPFPFFCDFHDDLAVKVREGRRREFAGFPQFKDGTAREEIPDPNSPATFDRAVLDWRRAELESHGQWLVLYRELIRVRRQEIIPRLTGLQGFGAHYLRFGANGLLVTWRLGDGSALTLLTNLGDEPCPGGAQLPPGRLLYASHPDTPGDLPAWCNTWSLDEGFSQQ